MQSPKKGALSGLWQRWKTLRLPWRNRFLVGSDLEGNTFWEFKDQIVAGRLRRMAVAFDKKQHVADIKISPQWHQWLRHTRQHAPSMEEQLQDVERRTNLKQLARLADERWAQKPSFLAQPGAPPKLVEEKKPQIQQGEQWQPQAWAPKKRV